MGKVSKIAYVDSSWSPWIGCTPASEGCKFCYANAQETRYGHDFSTVRRTVDATFYAPTRWKEPRRIFVCELSDFLHPDADEWRDDAYAVIRDTPWHTYLVCTKRIERTQQHFQSWPNIHLGVTAENQEQYNNRVLELLRLYHIHTWVSLEPLLGPIKMGNSLQRFRPDGGGGDIEYSAVHWVVVGGESGPNRREMKLEWLEDIVAQCKAANVPVFVKQDSALRPGQQGDIPDHLWKIKEFPESEAHDEPN